MAGNSETLPEKANGETALATEISNDPASSDTTGAVKSSEDPQVTRAQEELVKLVINDSADAQTPKTHLFWNTQPVPQPGQKLVTGDGVDGKRGAPIEMKTVEDVRVNPLNLISDFEWSTVDVTDETQLDEAYQLLNLHYVEDGDQMFRFDYSRDFLRWALMPPGWLPSWHLGVRVKSSKKLVAFITAVPATVSPHGQSSSMVEINFLCVHKKLRSKRLAPVLIQEITRRVNLENIWQAVYTAGVTLPGPVSTSRYYHRSLNPKKLIEVGFSRIAPRMTMARTIKLNALKSEPSIPGIRAMVKTDVPAACALFKEYNEQFELRIDFSEEDFAHWFLPRDRVVYSYVVENDGGDITDMCSFYSLPSSVIKHPKHSVLNAAYSFANVATTVRGDELMQDALVFAKNLDFDVFNALNLANNDEFLDKCKFHMGDGSLHFYIYNWQCPIIDRRKNALVLL